MDYKINQVSPWIDEVELSYIKRTISNKWLTEGPLAEEFIGRLKAHTGAKYAVLAPNGTLGLYLAIKSLNLPEGSEVIIPSFTFYASAASVVFAGLKPVFVDVSERDFNLDVVKLESLITANTSAIMSVHIYGQSADNFAIMDVAKKRGLVVIEDAAQAFNVFYQGKHCGTLGEVGVISFFADKTITTGEGAVVLTNSEKIFNNLKLIRNQGRPNSGTFIHPELGMNFRMTDLQCAIGLGQLDKLTKITNKRLKDYESYFNALAGVGDLQFLQRYNDSTFLPFRFYLLTKHKKSLADFLEKKLIQTRSFFYPLHKQPRLSAFKNDGCLVSESLYDRGLCLPLHYGITESDIDFISKNICEFFREYSK